MTDTSTSNGSGEAYVTEFVVVNITDSISITPVGYGDRGGEPVSEQLVTIPQHIHQVPFVAGAAGHIVAAMSQAVVGPSSALEAQDTVRRLWQVRELAGRTSRATSRARRYGRVRLLPGDGPVDEKRPIARGLAERGYSSR